MGFSNVMWFKEFWLRIYDNNLLKWHSPAGEFYVVTVEPTEIGTPLEF